MPTILFYLFAILMIAGGVCVVALKNPVSSAMGMIGSFVGIAALLIGINAFFVGTLMVLVYAGAIMVLFIFIIMLLDLKKETRSEFNYTNIAAGIAIPVVFVLLMVPILQTVEGNFTKLDGRALVAAEKQLPSEIAEDSIIRTSLRGEKDLALAANPQTATLPDVNLIGYHLYTKYNFPLQVVGVLLLVSTIGCVSLSKKLHGEEAPAGYARLAKTKPKSNEIPVAPALPKKQVEEVNEETTPEPVALVSTPPVEKTEVEEIETTPTPESTEEEKVEAQEEAETKPEAEPEPEAIEENEENTEEEIPEHSSIDEEKGLIYSERPDHADDLKVISGVGPVLEKKLNDFGIYTFKQVSEWSEANIAIFDDLLSFKGRIERDSWLDQAKKLHEQKYS